MNENGERVPVAPRRSRAWVVWAALGAGVVLLVLAARGGSLDYYRDVDALLASAEAEAERPVRVKGTVAPGSIRESPAPDEVRFALRGAHRSLEVVYRGVLPPLFAPGREVVVAGHLRSRPSGGQAQAVGRQSGSATDTGDGGGAASSLPLFEAYEILTKCPSKYEARKEAP
jgi:cytochrome c-type biogenesis protein CcmE